jgi:hypothetical protein
MRHPCPRSTHASVLLATLLLLAGFGCENAQAPVERRDGDIAWLFLYGPSTMYVGDTSRAIVHLRDADSVEIDPATRRLRWSISPASVATVDSTGKIYALAAGSALLRLQVDDRSDTLRFAVDTLPSTPPPPPTTPPPTSIPPLGQPYYLRLTAPNVILPGDTVGVSVAVMAYGITMFWADSLVVLHSNAPTVASIAPGDLVAGMADGSAILTATYRGLSAQTSIQVLGPPPSWGDFLSLTIGEYGTCGVQRGDGSLLCWGEGNPWGSPGGLPRAPMSVRSGASGFVSTPGPYCGLNVDGALLCEFSGTWTAPSSPQWRRFILDRSSLSFGSCGLVADSSAVCWYGGDSLITQVGGAKFIDFGMHSEGSGSRDARLCGIRADSTAVCWSRGSTTLTPVPGVTRVVEVKLGGSHECMRTADAEVWCSGSNDQGQLGNGTRVSSEGPTRVIGIPPAAALEVRNQATCAISVDQRAWCWGKGVAIPALVAGSDGFVQITLGPTHSCALKADGSAWCWGENFAGQIGDGTQLRREKPMRVRGSYPP